MSLYAVARFDAVIRVASRRDRADVVLAGIVRADIVRPARSVRPRTA